jgi:hypothetical protein
VSGSVGWAGVVLTCAAAALAALLEMFFVPLYAGTVVVPVAVLAAVAGNVVLPRLGHRLVPRTLAAVLPFLTWLAAVLVVGLVPRPEGDVVLPGGDPLQWVSYAVVLGGAVAGAVTVVWTSNAKRGRLNR